MTLPVWSPPDHSTFSVNVADLAYFNLGDMSSAADQAELVAMRSLFDASQIPTVTLLPRARHMPPWAVAPAVNVGDRISVVLDVGRFVLAVARERSTSTLQAQWQDFEDTVHNKVLFTDAQLLDRFTAYAGVGDAFIFVTRAPSPVVVSVSTVAPGALVLYTDQDFIAFPYVGLVKFYAAYLAKFKEQS